MEKLLLQLLESLEAVGREHDMLYDSIVRERLFETILDGFVKPRPSFVVPGDFWLDDPAANEAVASALRRYINDATNLAQQLGLDSTQERLAAFQNGAVHTVDEQQYPDDFFGWMDPNDLEPD